MKKLTLKEINEVIAFLITNHSRKCWGNKYRAIMYSIYYMHILKKEFLKLKRKNINLRCKSIRITSGKRRTVYFCKKLVPHLIDYFPQEPEYPNRNFCNISSEELEFIYKWISGYTGKKITNKNIMRRK